MGKYACDDCIYFNGAMFCKLFKGVLLEGRMLNCKYQEKRKQKDIMDKTQLEEQKALIAKNLDGQSCIKKAVKTDYSKPAEIIQGCKHTSDFIQSCHEAANIDFTQTENKYFGHHRFYQILDELKELHSAKNRDYATQSDPLRNFKESGKQCEGLLSSGNEALKICMVYMQKQFDAAKKLIAEGKSGGVENIATRLKDVAVYAVLGMILFEENFIEK